MKWRAVLTQNWFEFMNITNEDISTPA